MVIILAVLVVKLEKIVEYEFYVRMFLSTYICSDYITDDFMFI